MWNRRYSQWHQWNDSTKQVFRYRNLESGEIVEEEAFTSGLVFLHGTWQELPFTVTFKTGVKPQLEAEDATTAAQSFDGLGIGYSCMRVITAFHHGVEVKLSMGVRRRYSHSCSS